MTKRILIVDDDPNIRRIVNLALSEDSPYTVNTVSSAEAALLAISRQPVDLLFTDIRMPGMSGLDLVQRVHELDPTTAVIVFTVSPEDLTLERATELKIDCLLEKPASPERIRLAADLLLDPIKLLPRPSQLVEPPPTPAAPTTPPPASGQGALSQRIAAIRQRQTTQLSSPPTAPLKPLEPPAAPPAQPQPGGPMPPAAPPVQPQPGGPMPPATPPAQPQPVIRSGPAPVTIRLTPGARGLSGRSYSVQQIEGMREALKELALDPGVQCAVLADISGIVLTHWSRRRNINVTAVAALAAGNTMALAEIGRSLGQQHPGHLVIHEGEEQSIIIVTMASLLLLVAIGPNTSLGWARMATLRACEEVLRLAHA